jgi:tetratricopeptide (TPR) repeat protein
MSRTWKIILFALLIACLISAAWLVFSKKPNPQNESEVSKRVYELQKAGRYDQALMVLQTWMNDSRRDISKDDYLYQEIAMVYIAKTYKKAATRDESVHQAKMNLEKALASYDKHEPKDIDIELFEIGGAYAVLGDISEKEKCLFYSKAKESFARQLPLIKGDSYTAYGHTFNLERVRADIKKHLDGVNEKYSKAGCQATEEKSLR